MERPWLYATTGGLKGPGPYNPKPRLAGVAKDVLAVVASLRAADALPVGPRTIGYRLSMKANPSGLVYAKENEHVQEGMADFGDVTEVVKRLRQAGQLAWAAISDGSAVAHAVGGFDAPREFVEAVLDPDRYNRDKRLDQPVVVELYSESAELTPLLARTARPYGVRTYSGRGSAGPDLARDTAIRAMQRAVDEDGNETGVRTLIVGVGDFDHAGVQNVMRPHIEHVGAFLAEKGWEDILDFHRIAITPEQAITVATRLGEDTTAIRSYLASGDDDWTRDVRLLKGATKVETEALDPADLRDILVAEIEATLDMSTVERIREEQKAEREQIAEWRDQLGLEE